MLARVTIRALEPAAGTVMLALPVTASTLATDWVPSSPLTLTGVQVAGEPAVGVRSLPSSLAAKCMTVVAVGAVPDISSLR
jgi:hypothetical protein